MRNPVRLYEIDLLRLCAALAVLLHHLTFRGQVEEDFVYYEFPLLGEIFRYGYLGVDLFFLISGFVILLSASHSSPRRFLVGRLIRIYPAYLAAVLLTGVARLLWGGESLDTSWGEILINLTLVGGYLEGPLDFELMDGVYWSLLVELKFYLLIYLVLATGMLRHIEGLLVAWLTFTLATDYIAIPGPIQDLLLPEWAPYFIAGAVFYQVREQGISPLRLAMLVVTYLLAVQNAVGMAEDLGDSYNTLYAPDTIRVLITLFFAVFALLAGDALRFIRHPWLLPLGALTYPLYLTHQYLGYMMLNATMETDNDYLPLSLAVLTLLIVAWLIQRWVERPASRWLRTLATPTNRQDGAG